MDPKNIEKPFHDSTVYELERSVSLCTLCELESKYLYTDTPSYGLSLPLIELSSTSDDFSSLNLTPERPSVNDHPEAVADLPRYDDIADEGQFPVYKSTKNAALKISKKSPHINDDDISSSFLEFVQKTAKQVPDGLTKTLWDDVSWDKSDDKRESESSRGKTSLPTEKNSAVLEATENGIKSFISDIDDFLNEDRDKPGSETLAETKVRQMSPPRSFESDVRDERPRKRSKISALARRFIDTPEPKKFSERFMNRDNSTYEERSKNFAEDFRISSVIISRERQSGHVLLQDGVESLSDENISSKKSTKYAKSHSKMASEGQKVSVAMPNCTQSFVDEHIEIVLSGKITPEKQSNADEETVRYEENKMAAEPPPVQFSLVYGEREKIDSQYREDDRDVFEDDEKITRKKLKIEKARKKITKRSDVENFRKPEAEELPDKKSMIFVSESAEVPKSEETDHSFVKDEEMTEKMMIDNEEEITRSSVKSLPEVEEEMDTTEPEVHRAVPSNEGAVEETAPKTLKIIANMTVIPPLGIPLKPQDRNDRAESEDARKKHNEEVQETNDATNEATKTNVATNEITKANVATNEITKTNVATNKATKTNVPTDEDRDGKELAGKVAEAEELPERNERNRKSHCPEKPPMAEVNCGPDYTKTTEETFGEQLEIVENFITDGVSESPKGASRKKQKRSDTVKPEDKEKLTKSWKEVRKDFASTRDKRPRYPPLALPRTPPLPDLKTIKARAAKRRGVLADAINRLSSLNSYMGEVRSIFRNDNKQYTIVKPTRSSNGRMKILVSTSTQTSDGGQDPVDSLSAPPSTTVEGPAGKQLEQPDITHSGLFYYNLLHSQRDLKDEETSAQRRSKSAQNDKSDAGAVASGSEANPQNTLRELPVIVEKTTNLHNQEEIKHDMHSYNPLRIPREPKRLRKTVPNKKPTPASCKPLFLNRLL